jgi:hypothetical protein
MHWPPASMSSALVPGLTKGTKKRRTGIFELASPHQDDLEDLKKTKKTPKKRSTRLLLDLVWIAADDGLRQARGVAAGPALGLAEPKLWQVMREGPGMSIRVS